jgi:hypothetical protein
MKPVTHFLNFLANPTQTKYRVRILLLLCLWLVLHRLCQEKNVKRIIEKNEKETDKKIKKREIAETISL